MVKAAHTIENYVGDAVELDASGIPAVLTSRQSIAAFLGVGVGGVVQGRKFVFQGRDVDEKPKRKDGRPRRHAKPAVPGTP